MITGKRKPRTKMVRLDKKTVKKDVSTAEKAPNPQEPAQQVDPGTIEPQGSNVATEQGKITRQALMMQAKGRGIKNFRILNKKELQLVLAEDASAEQIHEIVSGAIARWKSGWGSRAKAQAQNAIA